MTARRRKWIAVTTLLVLAMLVWWWFARGGGKMEVRLILVGLTNGPDGASYAILLATNSGRSDALLFGNGSEHGPGRLEPLSHLQFKSPAFGPFHLPAPGKVFPARLKPGQVIKMSTTFTRLDEPMEAGLSAKRYELQDRLYCRMMSSMNRFLMTAPGRLLSQPPSTMPILDPVTNLPPTTVLAPRPSSPRL